MERLTADRYSRTRAHILAVRRVAAERFDPQGAATADRAISWALDCHLDQRDRADGAPYVEHVTSVAARVLGWSRSPTPELAAAALLHDALEDQEDSLAARSSLTGAPRSRALGALEGAFGSRVRAMIERLTNPDFDRIARDEHGLARETPAFDAVKVALYSLHFVEVFTEDREAALIKLADFSDNALRLHEVRAHSPSSHARLARKYGPCVAFLIDDLEALRDPDDPLFPIRDATLSALRAAWARDYAPGGSS